MGSGFRVQGSGLRVQGIRFRVYSNYGLFLLLPRLALPSLLLRALLLHPWEEALSYLHWLQRLNCMLGLCIMFTICVSSLVYYFVFHLSFSLIVFYRLPSHMILHHVSPIMIKGRSLPLDRFHSSPGIVQLYLHFLHFLHFFISPILSIFSIIFAHMFSPFFTYFPPFSPKHYPFLTWRIWCIPQAPLCGSSSSATPLSQTCSSSYKHR